MLGHGSPDRIPKGDWHASTMVETCARTRPAWYRWSTIVVLWLGGFTLCLTLPCVADGPENAGPIQSRLQLSWESDQPRQWFIRVSSNSRADLSDIANMCDRPESTGEFSLSDEGRVLVFRSHALTSRGRVQFTIVGNAKTRLLVERVSPDDPSKTVSESIALTSLLSEPFVSKRDQQTAKWSLGRVADDVIQLTSTGPTWPLTESNEAMNLSVKVNRLVSARSRPVLLKYELHRVADGRMVNHEETTVTLDKDGNSSSIKLDDYSPATPGVYEIRCRLIEDDNGTLLSRLRREEITIAELRRPLVVFADSEQASVSETIDDSAWNDIATIDPAEKPEWQYIEWISSQATRLIPGNQTPIEQDLPTSSHAGQSVSELRPGQMFVARLPRQRASFPHRLSLKLPRDFENRPSRLPVIEIARDPEFTRVVRKLLLTEVAGGFRVADGVFANTNPASASEQTPWHQLSFVHFPSSDNEFIRIRNRDSEKVLRFKSLTVSASPVGLTNEVPASEQDNQVQDAERVAAYGLTRLDWPETIAGDVERGGFHPSSVNLYRLMVATDRMTSYARYSGYNAIILPVNDDGRAWYSSQVFFPQRVDGSEDALRTDCVLRWMSLRKMDAILALKGQTRLPEIEKRLSDSKSEDRDFPSQLIRRSSNGRLVYNCLHPAIEEELRRVAAEVSSRFRKHRAFSGLFLDVSSESHFGPPVETDVTDLATLTRFADATGLAAPVAALPNASHPSAGREKLRLWISEKTIHLYRSILQAVPENKRVLLSHRPPGWSRSDAKHLSQGRLIGLMDRRRSAVSPWNTDLSSESNLADPLSNNRGRGVCIGIRRHGSDASVAQHNTLLGDDVIQAIRFLDPTILVVQNDGQMSDDLVSLSPATREALRIFRQLPRQRLTSIESLDPRRQCVQLRYGSSLDQVVVWAHNPAPWGASVRIEPAANCELRRVGKELDESAVDVSESTNESKRLITLSLSPGESVVLTGSLLNPDRSPPSPPVTRWECRVDVADAELEQIKKQVATVVSRVGMLGNPDDYASLSNGGFERTGGVGIPGWMHTQHPAEAVTLDKSEALEGQQSVRLRSDSQSLGRTWLVSESIVPPESGRLAVSFACRGELSRIKDSVDENHEHRVRVSLEANRGGQPVRFSQEILVRKNGQWQPRTLALEVTGVGPDQVDSLRLTIDSLSSGTIWVDDVHLHDRFPLKRERTELQGAVFLAMQGLQHGDLTHASRLLQNEWALELLNRIPKENAAVVESPPRQAEPEAEPPSVAERIKNWIPRPLRF